MLERRVAQRPVGVPVARVVGEREADGLQGLEVAVDGARGDLEVVGQFAGRSCRSVPLRRCAAGSTGG